MFIPDVVFVAKRLFEALGDVFRGSTRGQDGEFGVVFVAQCCQFFDEGIAVVLGEVVVSAIAAEQYTDDGVLSAEIQFRGIVDGFFRGAVDCAQGVDDIRPDQAVV